MMAEHPEARSSLVNARNGATRAMPIGHRALLEFAQAVSRVQKGCDEVVMPHWDSQDLDPLLTKVQPGTSPQHCSRIFIWNNWPQHITRSGSNSSHVPHLGVSPMHPDPSVGEKFLLEDSVNTANPLWLRNNVHVIQESNQPLLWSELLFRNLLSPCPRHQNIFLLSDTVNGSRVVFPQGRRRNAIKQPQTATLCFPHQGEEGLGTWP